MPVTSEFRMLCLPDQWPETTVIASRGWSPSLKDVCLHVSAFNAREGERSITVSEAYPQDCIAVPEPDALVMLTVGFMFLIALAMGGVPPRRRR